MRKISFAENIKSEVDVAVKNGILRIELPKQKSKSIEETGSIDRNKQLQQRLFYILVTNKFFYKILKF